MDYMTVTEAAKALNVTPMTVRVYIKRGLLPGATKIRGTQWRIPRSNIEFFDGVDISGTFAKQPKEPFCKIERAVDSWACLLCNGEPLEYFDDEDHALMFCESLNDAANAWAKNA